MSNDRRSKDYEDGVNKFIAFVVQNYTYKSFIKCLCLQCGNEIFNTP